jgi:hypothetical protein
MSNSAELKEEAEVCCASCGIAELDDIKLLKGCSGGCDLVKYCSDECQEHHRELHEEECKKRKAVVVTEKMAVLRRRKLFEQPDGSDDGDCPICFLPMPSGNKSCFYSCCCNSVCDGCVYAARSDNCPFCREPIVHGDEKNYKRVMERVKVNDPNALRKMGSRYYKEEDYDKAFEYYTKAAELGDAASHYGLGCMYRYGRGVEKDKSKMICHYMKAAIGGNPYARHYLGCHDKDNKRAVKHLIIAANLGYERSMKQLWKRYSAGHITKENLESTLRSHKAAIDATKSAQRDAAAEAKPTDWT